MCLSAQLDALEIASHRFVTISVWDVGRQSFQADAVSATVPSEAPDCSAAKNHSPVPEHQEFAHHVLLQVPRYRCRIVDIHHQLGWSGSDKRLDCD